MPIFCKITQFFFALSGRFVENFASVDVRVIFCDYILSVVRFAQKEKKICSQKFYFCTFCCCPVHNTPSPVLKDFCPVTTELFLE